MTMNLKNDTVARTLYQLTIKLHRTLAKSSDPDDRETVRRSRALRFNLMKRGVRVPRALMVAGLLVLLSASAACAEWGLYVNRDGRAWVLEQTFAFESETDRNCKSAARALWQSGTVKGVACQEYAAVSYSATAKAREQAAAQAAAQARANVAAQQSAQQEQKRQETREDQANREANRAVITGAKIQAGATRDAGSNVADAIRNQPFNAGSIRGSFRGGR